MNHSPASQAKMLLLLAPSGIYPGPPFLFPLLTPELYLLPQRQKSHQEPKPSSAQRMKPAMEKGPRLAQQICKP